MAIPSRQERPGQTKKREPWVSSEGDVLLSSSRFRVSEAAVSVLVAVLTFGALHDITTGLEPDVSLEQVALLVCAGWWMFIIARLFARGHRVASVLSALAVIATAWGLPAISTAGHAWEHAPRMLAGAALWFGVLSLLLFVWMDVERGASPR